MPIGQHHGIANFSIIGPENNSKNRIIIQNFEEEHTGIRGYDGAAISLCPDTVVPGRYGHAACGAAMSSCGRSYSELTMSLAWAALSDSGAISMIFWKFFLASSMFP